MMTTLSYVLRNKPKDLKCLEFPTSLVDFSHCVLVCGKLLLQTGLSSFCLSCVLKLPLLSAFCLTGRVVFHMSDWLHHCLAAGRILFKNTFEAYMDQYMQSKLEQILQEHHMVSLITQLRGRKECVSAFPLLDHVYTL